MDFRWKKLHNQCGADASENRTEAPSSVMCFPKLFCSTNDSVTLANQMYFLPSRVRRGCSIMYSG